MIPLSSAVICIESITSLCWGGSSRAAIPGVCLALVQGSCLANFIKGGGGGSLVLLCICNSFCPPFGALTCLVSSRSWTPPQDLAL